MNAGFVHRRQLNFVLHGRKNPVTAPVGMNGSDETREIFGLDVVQIIKHQQALATVEYIRESSKGVGSTINGLSGSSR